MKNLEKIPNFICEEGSENFIAYNDTDSLYVNAEPIVKYLFPDFEDKSDKEKDKLLEKVALQYQDLINKYYNEMAVSIFNVKGSHRFEMKTEAVIRSAYFRATRRYAQWITKSEGVDVDKLDIKGLEFMKANFPPIFGDFFNETLEKVLKGGKQNDIDNALKKFKEKILSENMDFTLLGNPTSVKTLNKYLKSKPKSGEIFSIISQGAPAPVKAAIKYNDLLKFWNLDKQHSTIVQGDKVKWVYLNPNPYRIEAIAFLEFDIPERIRTLIEQYIDRTKSFETILESKLKGFYEDLNWDFNMNPYRNIIFEF